MNPNHFRKIVPILELVRPSANYKTEKVANGEQIYDSFIRELDFF